MRGIYGVPVRIGWDTVLLLALPFVGWVAAGRQGALPVVGAIIGAVIGVFYLASMATHELAHVAASTQRGIPVREVRLSVLGGATEIAAERGTPTDECLIALAGLGTSAAIGAVAGIAALLLRESGGAIYAVVLALAAINGVLFGLNALPAFPLDGGRIVRAAAWYLTDDLVAGTRFAAAYGQFSSWVLLALGVTALFVAPAAGVWVALLGYAIGRAGRIAFLQVLWRETSRHLPIETVTGPGPLLAPDKFVGEVVDVFLSDRLSGPRPVGRNGEMIGILDLDTNVRRVPRTLWMETTVGTAMTPIEQLPRLVLTPGMTLFDGLKLLDETGQRTVAVVDGTGTVRGIVTKERIDRWVRSRLREDGVRVRTPPTRAM